jgi:GNAT superfamily N-acetyltransferase
MSQSTFRANELGPTVRRARESDRYGIVEAYVRSQRATGIPDPEYCPPDMLGERLYQRLAVGRFVVDREGVIAGHGLVELPNPDNIGDWLDGSIRKPEHLLELGGAFVHPDYEGQGIWTSLLQHRLAFVRSAGKTAVTATWSQNEHVRRVFERNGANQVGEKSVNGGEITLYRFD